MSVEKRQGTAQKTVEPARGHWSGLPKPSRQVAVFVLATILLADLVLIAIDYGEHGLKGISGGYHAVDFWDVAKAIATGSALLVVAHHAGSVPIRILGFVFLILGLEDLITLHGVFGNVLNRLSGGLVPGRVGELIAFAGFALLAFFLVWARNPPGDQIMRRARLVITALLVAMFIFTAVVDFFALGGGSSAADVVALIEESGERFTLTLATAYAAGLASIRE